MKKEVRLLLSKAVDSVTVAIELFNRPVDTGRPCTVLILLDHSFEMLLKAAILHRGGSIREPGAANTIGHKTCISRACTSGSVKCISDDQAALLRSINSLRDAMQHYLLDISEHMLYLQVLAAVTLFRDLLASVFSRNLATYLPQRVLPVASSAPIDLVTVFENEVDAIRQLLQPGRRMRTEALAKLRTLVIIENALGGEENPPAARRLGRLASSLQSENALSRLFPGVASTDTALSGTGPLLELRMTKRDGAPVFYSNESIDGLPLASRKVSEIDYYCLSSDQIAVKLGISRNDVLALIHYLRIQEDDESFRALRVYRNPANRYSHVAVSRLRAALLDSGELERARTAYRSHCSANRGRR